MKNTKKMILAALFAALTCVATMVIRIPTPGTSGYIHPGDALVILSGIFLGPGYGALAAGIGSAMSDLIGGYFIYVPITFAVKGVIAFAVSHVYGSLTAKGVHPLGSVAAGGVIDAFLVVAGYGLCEMFLYSVPAAVAGMLPNLVQGISGLVIAMLLYPVLSAVPEFRNMAGNAVGHHKR